MIRLFIRSFIFAGTVTPEPFPATKLFIYCLKKPCENLFGSRTQKYAEIVAAKGVN